MAMKMSTISPVDSRLTEISWLMLLAFEAEELTGTTCSVYGARTAPVEVPARTSRS